MFPVLIQSSIWNADHTWRTAPLSDMPDLLRGVRDDPEHFFLTGVGPGRPRWETGLLTASYQDIRDLCDWAAQLQAVHADDPSSPAFVSRTLWVGTRAGSTISPPSPGLAPVGLTPRAETALYLVRLGARRGVTTSEQLWRAVHGDRPIEDMNGGVLEDFAVSLMRMSDESGLHGCVHFSHAAVSHQTPAPILTGFHDLRRVMPVASRHDDAARSQRWATVADVTSSPEAHPCLIAMRIDQPENPTEVLDAARRRDLLWLAGSLRRVQEGGEPSPGTVCERVDGCLVCLPTPLPRQCMDFTAVSDAIPEEGLTMVSASNLPTGSPGSVVMLFTKGCQMLATTIDVIWSTKWPEPFERREREEERLQDAVTGFVMKLGLER